MRLSQRFVNNEPFFRQIFSGISPTNLSDWSNLPLKDVLPELEQKFWWWRCLPSAHLRKWVQVRNSIRLENTLKDPNTQPRAIDTALKRHYKNWSERSGHDMVDLLPFFRGSLLLEERFTPMLYELGFRLQNPNCAPSTPYICMPILRWKLMRTIFDSNHWLKPLSPSPEIAGEAAACMQILPEGPLPNLQHYSRNADWSYYHKTCKANFIDFLERNSGAQATDYYPKLPNRPPSFTIIEALDLQSIYGRDRFSWESCFDDALLSKLKKRIIESVEAIENDDTKKDLVAQIAQNYPDPPQAS